MKYGHFDDQNREYVIQTPQTPYPWINYLGSERFFSIISNTGGGYSFYKDARLRRITRYRYNNIPLDSNGKFFFINDGKEFWSLTWQPVRKDVEQYECRHGMGYTKIKSLKNNVETEVTSFVPLNFCGEIQKVTIKNTSDKQKTLKLFSYVEWCFWNALDDFTNFQRNLSTGEVEIKDSVLYHKTEYRERRNHYAFYSVNQSIQGFDTDREQFLGLYNGLENPAAVAEGKPSNSEAHGWSPIASHYIEIELDPGMEKSLVFLLGYVENEDDKKWEARGIIDKARAEEMISAYKSVEQVDAAFAELKEHWEQLLTKYQVQSHDEKLDRMVNTWNQYQCMVTFNMSRSASYFESGIGRGMGFRDSNQDLIGFVHMIPERAKERILDIAATQLEDGGAYHQYQPLTKRGNNEIGGNFNDDPLWLILSVSAYIKETGDWSIIDEQVSFDNDIAKAASLFEHLKRSFYHVVNNLGPHNLPLIGRADWNDCLNLNCFSTNPDESFQTTENKEGGKAESLMIAGLFVLYGKEFIQLCKEQGKADEVELAQKHITDMEKAINEHGWDGEWFIRAYDHNGHKVGSHVNAEGKIFIESQGFCSMAGVGEKDGRARKALDSVKQHLDCDYGIVLQNPPYSKYYLNLGEISTYPQGYKENAGIFCHNNPWIMIAETMLGDGNQAFEYYKKITPAYLEEISGLHRVEPYVYCQMIAGKDAFKPGEGKNSWLTGTAAWNFYTVSQYILGIRPQYDGLLIDPCIPKEWDGFKITRKYRGAVYEIEVQNPAHVSKGVKKIILDNTEISGQILPVCKTNTVRKVKVVMG